MHIVYRAVLSILVLPCLLLGCASPWVGPEPEPEALRELRPKLATLRQGMSEEDTFRALGLSASDMESGGCLHGWNYTRFYDRDYLLTVHFDREGTNGLALGWAKVTVFKRREEGWPK